MNNMSDLILLINFATCYYHIDLKHSGAGFTYNLFLLWLSRFTVIYSKYSEVKTYTLSHFFD